MKRRKISAVHKDFELLISRLERLDDLNQERYQPGPGRPSTARLTKSQTELLCEGILTKAFSAYEKFLEECFLLYAIGKSTKSGSKVGSFLNAKDGEHARSLIKSGMTFLEWNSPDNVIERSQTYLHSDSPPFVAISANKTRLGRIRKIRNAIAHASPEATAQFLKVVQSELGTFPLSPPTPGAFLMMTNSAATPSEHFLRTYLSCLRTVGNAVAN